MNQPRALYALSLTEMWERFGLYIVQGLLIFYMTKVLNFPDTQSYAIMGQFTALIYLSPIIGGLCADRFLGFRHTILIGAYLLLAGYALLTLPLANKEAAMFLGLSVIILGTGFLKPNISSFLGRFYHENDPRRDAGFTIYYMVFNFGVFISTLSSGSIQTHFGWHACFGAAVLGLLLAILFFRLGYRFYGDEGLPLKRTGNSVKDWFYQKGSSLLVVILGVTICYHLLKLVNFGNTILTIFGLLVFAFLIIITFRLDKVARQKMLALLILIFVSIAFWAIYFQIFLVENLFIDRNVDRFIFGKIIHPVVFISLQPFFILLLSPPFAFLWKKIQSKEKAISRGLQFTLALAIIGVALQVLVFGIHLPETDHMIRPFWIVLSYLIITVGELMLSPIGLSMVTQFAPQKLVAVMMGVWFLGLSYGGLLAGYLGKQASIPKELIGNTLITNPIYAHAFQNYAYLGFGVAVFTLILTPWLNRLTIHPSKQT